MASDEVAEVRNCDCKPARQSNASSNHFAANTLCITSSGAEYIESPRLTSPPPSLRGCREPNSSLPAGNDIERCKPIYLTMCGFRTRLYLQIICGSAMGACCWDNSLLCRQLFVHPTYSGAGDTGIAGFWCTRACWCNPSSHFLTT
jgi:hypothetical protein